MSKTKGTGVDPLQLTQQFGTDALRYMLASMAAPGTDIILSEDRILGARNFANKIWNAARFLFVQSRESRSHAALRSKNLPRRKFAPRRRTRSRAKARSRIAGFFRDSRPSRRRSTTRSKISASTRPARRSTNSSGAISATGTSSGSSRSSPQADRDVSLAGWRNIFAALDSALRLLHPVMPFLTEELWHKLPQPAGARSIALDKFPEPRPAIGRDAGADDAMAAFRKSSIAARNIRAEMKIDPKRRKSPRISRPAPPMLRHLLEDNLDPDPAPRRAFQLRVPSEHLDPQAPSSARPRHSICASPTATPSTSPPKPRA